MRRYITVLGVGFLVLSLVSCGSKSTRNYETLVTVQAAKPPDYGPIGEAGKVLCFTLIAVAVIAAACHLAKSGNAQKRNSPKQQRPGRDKGSRRHRRRHPPHSRHHRGRRHSRGQRHKGRSPRRRHHNRKKLQPIQPVQK